jgi:primosomal replication protein N
VRAFYQVCNCKKRHFEFMLSPRATKREAGHARSIDFFITAQIRGQRDACKHFARRLRRAY